MKKGKLSIAEKRLIRGALILFFVQVIIIMVTVRWLSNSQPIALQDTKRISITVDDIYYFSFSGSSPLSIYSDNVKYSFHNRNTAIDYSNDKLYRNISVGDHLTITYYERKSLLGSKWVVDARSGNKVYRSYEEYNKVKKAAPLVVAILFIIMQLFFVVFCAIYFSPRVNVWRELRKRIRRMIKNIGNRSLC